MKPVRFTHVEEKNKQRLWRHEDLVVLITLAKSGKTPSLIASHLKRTPGGIENKLRKLNIPFKSDKATPPKIEEPRVLYSPYNKPPDDSPIKFAQDILIMHGRISIQQDIERLDGDLATPYKKMKALNRILKAKGFPQIDICQEWVV